MLVKWFVPEDDEVPHALALREAHLAGMVNVRICELAAFEVGNVLLRRHGWPAEAAADQLEDLLGIVGDPVATTRTWLRDAADLAETKGLTFYGACWAAAARHHQVPLVSADRQPLAAGLAESPTDAARRLHLLP